MVEESMRSRNALPDLSLHLGIIGTMAFTVFVLIFREDWTGRYQYLSYLVPIPVFFLLIARKNSGLGGMLLIALAIGVGVFDVFFSPAHPGLIVGTGFGYTLIFVTLPILMAGVLFLLQWRKSK